MKLARFSIVLLAPLLAAALPAKAQQIGPIYCSKSAVFDGTGTNRMITGTQGNSVYICGYDVSAVAATTIQLKTGTGTNCGTGTANLTPAWNVGIGASNFGVGNFSGIGPVPPLVDICETSGAAVQITIYYSQQ